MGREQDTKDCAQLYAVCLQAIYLTFRSPSTASRRQRWLLGISCDTRSPMSKFAVTTERLPNGRWEGTSVIVRISKDYAGHIASQVNAQI